MENKTILLVEDNPDDVTLILRALNKNSDMSNRVIVAQDGIEALDYLFATGAYEGRDPSIMPELILLDLKLSKVNGLEILKFLRNNNRTKQLPVVILSSSKNEYDLIKSFNLGATSYIYKSADFSQLTNALKQLDLYFAFNGPSMQR